MITRQQILDFIDDTRILRGAEVSDILNLSERYPYCQTLQLLKIIGLRNNDDIEYKNQLNLASVYSGDRSLLYEYIIRDSLLQTIAIQDDDSTDNNHTDSTQNKETKENPESDSKLQVTTEPDNATEKSQQDIINPLPLEEQILQAAIIHTAELEVDNSLSQLPKLPSKANQQPEQPEEQQLTFAQWLLKKDGKSETLPKASKLTSSGLISESTEDIIDNFIQTKPQISPVKATFFSPVNMGKMSLVEDETFVTETLANIYMRQGEYRKALRAYENLSLRIPEKKTYFARLIKEAQEKIQKKN